MSSNENAHQREYTVGGTSHEYLKVASALNVKVMEIPSSVVASEQWLRDDLEEVFALLFRFLGDGLQRGLACDAEVSHSGARSHRLRAVVDAARQHGKLCHLSTHIFPASLSGAFL